MPQPTVLKASWYDHPKYFDIAFSSETRMEADFIEAACTKYCPFPAKRMLEPACGTGRLVTEMAARGYDMTGIDLSEPSTEFLKRRLARKKLQATVRVDDMADFRLPSPVDAAFCTFNSFRHLTTEKAARRHLECVADSLRPGGIYILGLHLLPLDVDEESTERWTERQGNTQVTVTFRVLEADRRSRIEQIRVSMLVREGRDEKMKTIRLRDEFPLRMYTPAQFRRLLNSVPAFELCDIYDFWYEIDHPLEFNDDLADSVFILRKR
jgi:SAM-dependent methyltransferase